MIFLQKDIQLLTYKVKVGINIYVDDILSEHFLHKTDSYYSKLYMTFVFIVLRMTHGISNCMNHTIIL